MEKTTGKLAPQNKLNEQQEEVYYSNLNNALTNMTTLINGKSVFESLSRTENGITISITIDLEQATK